MSFTMLFFQGRITILSIFFYFNSHNLFLYNHTESVNLSGYYLTLFSLSLLNPNFNLGTPSNTKCALRPWFLCLGFTLTVGTLLTKNLRIARIFDNKKLRKKQVKESVVWAYLLLLCTIDIVGLGIWMITAKPTAIKQVKSFPFALPFFFF